MSRLSSLKSLLSGNKGINYINGSRVIGSGTPEKLYNPACGQVVSEFARSTQNDFNEAIEFSKIAQKSWAQESPMARGDILIRAANLLDTHREEIAQIECSDSGKPILETRLDIQSAIDALKYCGGTSPALLGGETQQGAGWKGHSRRIPCGVVAGIGAWNYPIQIAAFKAAPALACGNSVIFKPSNFTPLSAVTLGEVFKEAGLPDGLFQVLQGEREIGEIICQSPDINKITFTGSVQTGVAILAESAKHIRPVTLELGGKSPLVIFNDFDVDNAVQGAMQANFYSQGQVCSNGTRVYVHEEIYDEFVQKLITQVSNIKIGNPKNDETRMGALVAKDHKEKVQAYLSQALSEGAKLIYGGKDITINGLEEGYYLEPTILECHDDLTISSEEIFGPVLQLYKFKTEDEVLARANNSNLGLAAGIFTNDFHRIDKFTELFESGTLYVNCYNLAPAELGFGGLKQSGIGKENGTEYIGQFTRLKTVFYPTLDNRKMEF